jgi:putative ABC transport system permease protein
MVLKDFDFAARTLCKNPASTIAGLLTIALGIGASTAIFSITNAVLLRPLPYLDPDRLVIACCDLRKRDVRDFPFSNADFFDLREGAKRTFEEFSAVVTNRIIIPKEDGTPEQVRIAAVTTNFFRMMGARIPVGRDFADADGVPQPPLPPPGSPQASKPAPRLPIIAIISHEYWQRRYGGNPAVVGSLNTYNQRDWQIVGVLPPHFELFFPPDANIEVSPDIWAANRLAYDAANRHNVSLRVIGKLRQGVTLQQAQAEADTVAAELRSKDNIASTADQHIRLEPMHRHLVAEVRPAILALMGAVIFLLLIACANVANLLLVRVSLREREMSLRAAIGAGRWRLVRQMLAEALLLAAVGAVAGVGLAWIGLHEMLAIAPAHLPRMDSIRIDSSVLAFTAAMSLAAAAVFGMVPALRASQPDVMNALRGSSRTAGLGVWGLLRNVVVIVEVTLSFVLLIGSGLMVRSFLELQRINPGFDERNLLTFQLLGGRGGPEPQKRAAFMQEIAQRLRAIPGVQAVTASFPFPLAGGFSPIRWGLEEALSDASKFSAADFQIVLPGYFDTLRTPLIAGRTFTEADNAPGRDLVVIDEFLARKAFPHQSAVGKRILIRVRTQEPEWVEVIGVVAHQRQTSLADRGREQVYFTDAFLGFGAANQWALRTGSDPAQYASAVRAEIGRIDPHLLIAGMEPMTTVVERAQAGTRFSLLLISMFAVIAAILAAVGLYGVLASLVRQRTAEIGVRMALGASPSRILQLVVWHGLRLSCVGVAIGLIGALALTRVMTSMLVGIQATDPATFIAMAAVFLLIAAASSWLPARRAAGLDPTAALRVE